MPQSSEQLDDSREADHNQLADYVLQNTPELLQILRAVRRNLLTPLPKAQHVLDVEHLDRLSEFLCELQEKAADGVVTPQSAESLLGRGALTAQMRPSTD